MSPLEDADIPLREFISAAYASEDAQPPQHAFDRAEYEARRMRLQLAAAAAGLDLLVLSSPEAMCWLHGYQSRWYRAQSSTRWPPYQCTVMRVDSGEYVVYDVEHHDYLLRRTSVATDIRLTGRDDGEAVLDFAIADLRARGWLTGRAGLEFHSHVPNRATSEMVQAALEFEGCRVVDASAAVRSVRKVKSAAEIAMIERAAEVCDVGLRALQAEVRPGMTEKHAWGVMVAAMAAAGGEPAALHESVVVGPIELGHAYSSDRTLVRGDVLCADPCGVVSRYHANIERWFVVGAEPNDELYRLAEIEAEAFRILCAHAADGVRVDEVTGHIEQHLRDAGLWGLHDWNGGYEMGLSFPPDWVGEWTFTVGEASQDRFEAGTVTNYESIVLYPMIDTVVFGADGARTLSALPLDVMRAG
ncbi:M24 family metallopeptidase [Mycobacterium sp. ACS4331]|uniref:M24 family metallopeptidase n=1 Tax=Mycobacterium sp. ACS4331 TaxID=1834121 RepID=UPI0008002C31|nr:M24 family metallopeptidase [Mycobacterium sp. ACS4331]OBF25530.1 peptidase M24 [Mycobacterium sp. ACS4331]